MVNSFIMKKVIDFNIDNAVNAKKLASGNLLVQTLNVSQVKSLLKLQLIHDIEIEAFIPVSMNSCRRVASQCDFVDMDETEITDYLADQDVIEARKITKNSDDTRRSTASVIFNFQCC